MARLFQAGPRFLAGLQFHQNEDLSPSLPLDAPVQVQRDER
jgi:hypothetical protein